MNAPFSLQNKKVWIAGASGMVGQALMRRLAAPSCTLLDCDRQAVDLRRQAAVEDWVAAARPNVVVIAAAKVGGIKANQDQPADFLYDNLMIAANIIHAAHATGVQKLLFLGSSCIYPRAAEQPITEDALLTGPLEPTNEAYALAKIAGIKLCQSYRKQHGCDFISAMPCNLYGPGDRYDAMQSHVIPAMILKFDAAKRRGDATVTLWGTGRPLREFLHVNDLAAALICMLENYSDAAPVNIGSGEETSIADLAAMVAAMVGYEGGIVFDAAFPDGTPRKVLASETMGAFGWRPAIALEEGLRDAWRDYQSRFFRSAP